MSRLACGCGFKRRLVVRANKADDRALTGRDSFTMGFRQPQCSTTLRAFAITGVLISWSVAHSGDLLGETKDLPPNFVFLLVDDLGWTDVGCFGSTFYETPQIDRLAERGMKFTQAYAACPVCSPTRASLLTGRHPIRVGITDWIPGMPANRWTNPRFGHVHDRDELALSELTLAEVLSAHGYETFFAGKWHLGGRGYWPKDQGFDVNIGGNEKGSPPGGYYAPWTNPTLKANEPGEYLTERLTEEAVNFIQSRQTPFLLYLSYYNVHTPITPYAKRIQHFSDKAAALGGSPAPRKEHFGWSNVRQDKAAYASMIAAVDASVGRILDVLDEMKLTRNTVVCFFSDNGGLCTSRQGGPTSNLPLRAGKGWLYEGGIRVPCLISAPGITTPSSTCDTPVMSMDFFPTLLELAAIPPVENVALDGVSLVPLMTATGVIPSRTLVWHYPHYHGSTWAPGAAIRIGPWKLIDFYEWRTVELYNLDDDPGEKNDLSETFQDRTRSMQNELRQWQSSMGATMPAANPDYDP